MVCSCKAADSLRDVSTIRSPLPIARLSADADAMAAYTNSHSIPLSPHAKDGLSTAATRGRKLFFSTETKCASCHSGPYYSDSRPNAEFIVHDVGTGNDDPTELMGPKYDTPDTSWCLSLCTVFTSWQGGHA